MSLILGISNGHDASVTALSTSETLVLEKERFCRRKHAAGELGGLIPLAAQTLGATLGEVTRLAVVPPIWAEAGYDWKTASGRLPTHPGEATSGSAFLGADEFPATFVPHHMAHAAYAYFSSGLPAADVLTIDAGGTFTDCSVSSWRDGSLEAFEPLEVRVGSLWSVLADQIFGDIFAAGKVMGLAACGEPRFVRDIYKDFARRTDASVAVSAAWEKRGCLSGASSWHQCVSRDLACSLQRFTNEVVLDVVEAYRARSGGTRLCVSGGVALNGYLNSWLQAQSGYDSVFCPGAVHDGGLSLGAALFARQRQYGRPEEPGQISPFLGVGIDGDLPDITDGSGVDISTTAKSLLNGELIGVATGRAEIGPRALGNRSLLARADLPWITSAINSQFKDREPFRPVAPVIRERDADVLLKFPGTCNGNMTKIGALSEDGKEVLGGVAHFDGTVRAQIVGPDLYLHDLIDELESLGAAPALVNTSFNLRGWPIVNTLPSIERTAELLGLDGLVFQTS